MIIIFFLTSLSGFTTSVWIPNQHDVALCVLGFYRTRIALHPSFDSKLASFLHHSFGRLIPVVQCSSCSVSSVTILFRHVTLPQFTYPSTADGLVWFFQFGAITNTSRNTVVSIFWDILNMVFCFCFFFLVLVFCGFVFENLFYLWNLKSQVLWNQNLFAKKVDESGRDQGGPRWPTAEPSGECVKYAYHMAQCSRSKGEPVEMKAESCSSAGSLPALPRVPWISRSPLPVPGTYLSNWYNTGSLFL